MKIQHLLFSSSNILGNPRARANHFITQPSVYKVIVYFLLCHESLNYWPGIIFDYWLALYHGLVSRFPVKNTQALIDMHNDNAHTVHLWKETLYKNGENKAWFGNLKLQ